MKDKIMLQLSTNSYILYHILSKNRCSREDYATLNAVMKQLDNQQEIGSKLAELIVDYTDRSDN